MAAVTLRVCGGYYLRVAGKRPHTGEAPRPVPGPGPERVALTTALARLPEKQRRALVLYYLAESTVRVWLHRGRAALATLLADNGLEPRHE